MRLPGTFAKLYEDLRASPFTIRRVEIPTKHGPLVLEFDGPRAALAAVPPAPRSDPRPLQQGERPANPKVRDLDLLKRQEVERPIFRYETETDAAG